MVAQSAPTGSGSQIGVPDSSVTQNHSNFFQQIKEIAQNIEDGGQNQVDGNQSRAGGEDQAAVDVNIVTDEMTELDARRIGNSDREGFDGFETSVMDNQPKENGQ